ncbi:MAG: peroxiredoxin [Planctomycetes bacterium]|nr:peroxiredoxin [Planctomycetota bacterium]
MAPDRHDPHVLPEGLAAPVDDGAARHLRGAKLPPLELASTSGELVNLAELARFPHVLFFYPRTGVPGQAPGDAWNRVPGARGCTPQSLGFKALFAEFARRDVEVFGVSTQTSAYQREFREREQVPYHFLSDAELLLARAMQLPTFDFPIASGGPRTLIQRMCWFVDTGIVEELWYPVFPPDRNARIVLDWLDAHPR